MTMESWIAIPMTNLATVGAMMTVGWIFSVLYRNVTIVDSLWGLGFVLVAGVTFWTGGGFGGRSLLILVLTACWGLRLAGYLTWRNWGKPEDHRYGQWREKSGQRFWIVSLFTVFWLQALFLWFISLVLQKAQLSAAPFRFTALDILGTAVWSVGFVFESVGDWQLARFKADPKNRGRVMDQGLWAWSRHPNYFGEFLIWWGFFLVALTTPGGWWTVISPIIISIVLLKMTGVPLTEAALKTRRPGYAEYIENTSTFFPRPPRKKVG
jgi:steroid 5-alpha reductase family enzyme